MENKAHALAAGLFVLTVTALLVALATWLTRDVGVRRVYEMTTRDSVAGLQPQASVRYRGIAVGKVTDIGFDAVNTGQVLVRMSIDAAAPITTTTYATLNFQGVTGLAFVQLDDNGQASPPLVASGEQPPRIPLRPSLLSKLSDQGAGILVQVEEVTRRVNQLLAPDNQKAMLQAMQSIGQAADGVNALTARMDSTVQQKLDPALASVPAVAQDASKALQALANTSSEFAKAANDLSKVAKRLTDQGGTLDKVAEGSDALSGAVASLQGATLPRVNRVSEEASRTARQVNRTVGAIADNPQALIFGSGHALPGPGEPGFAAPGGSK